MPPPAGAKAKSPRLPAPGSANENRRGADSATAKKGPKKQEQQRRKPAPAEEVINAPNPFELMGGGGPWYATDYEPSGSGSDFSRGTASRSRSDSSGSEPVQARAPTANQTSKDQGATPVNTRNSGGLSAHGRNSKHTFGALASLLVMSRDDADAFLKNVGKDAHIDHWDVGRDKIFIVYSEDAEQWNSIGQFIRVERLKRRRRFTLVVNEPSSEPTAVERVEVTDSWAVHRIVLKGVMTLGLGTLLAWLIAGRILTLISCISLVKGRVGDTYLRTGNLIKSGTRTASSYLHFSRLAKAALRTSARSVGTCVAQLGRAASTLRSEVKRSVQRRIRAVIESTLVYLEDLHDPATALPNPFIGEDAF